MTAKKKTASDDASAQTPAFEECLGAVEKKLEALESGELTLEQSLTAYEEGVKSLKQCYAILKSAEGRIEMLTGTGGEPELADYDAETGGVSGKPRKVIVQTKAAIETVDAQTDTGTDGDSDDDDGESKRLF